MEVVQYGNRILRKQCIPVVNFDDKLASLAKKMLATMSNKEGIGLAAPQVNLCQQLVVIDLQNMTDSVTLFKVDSQDQTLKDWMPLCFVNPKITKTFGSATENEGCLSIRDVIAPVTRAETITVQVSLLDSKSIEIETNGLLARALQHEIDHLNGILFIDRVSPIQKAKLKKTLKNLSEKENFREIVAFPPN